MKKNVKMLTEELAKVREEKDQVARAFEKSKKLIAILADEITQMEMDFKSASRARSTDQILTDAGKKLGAFKG